MFRIHKKWFSHTGEDDKIYIQCVPGESKLSQKYAFNKKSTIFTQSLQNFDKTGYALVPYLDKVL